MSPEFRGLATVTRGLQFFCAGLVVLAGALTVSPGAAPFGIVLDFIGRSCCLAVPRKSRCLGLVRASILCSLIAVALILIILAYFKYDHGSIALSIVDLAASLTVAAEVLFLIAVRRLAEYVGQPRLASAARSILMAGLCFSAFVIGLTFLVRALSRLFPATGPGALFLNPWGFLLIPILWISWFAAAVIVSIYAYIVFKLSHELRKAAIEYGDKRGARPDEAEHAGTKPGPNADIEKLLELYDER